MSINIKIQKKDLWLLSAIVVFLVGVGYVIAWQSGNPAVMGHTIDEIEGFNDTVITIVNNVFGGELCGEDPIYNSLPTGNVIDKPGYSSIRVPNSCISETGCDIIQEIYDKNSTGGARLKLRRRYAYSQSQLDSLWWSDYQTAGTYKNGDGTETNIIPSYNSGNIFLRDDKKAEPGKETDSTYWTARDNSNKYGQKIYTCGETA